MPSAFAESLFYRLTDSFPPRRGYGSAAFEREPMPSSVAYFLRHWLRHRLRHEATRLELPRSDWFDYDHEAVQRASRDLATVLIEHGHFPAALWETSLREAIQQVTAYLVHPVTTLTAFVFQENNSSVPAEVLTWRLGYFKDYPYLHKAIQGYLEKHNIQTVERTRLTEMLRAVDRKTTRDYDTDAWLTLLAPLFDLARLGPGVPMPLLLNFFKDKEAELITKRLSRHQQHQSGAVLDEEELRRILAYTDEPVLPVAPPAMPPVASKQAQGPLPRWKQFQLNQTAPPPPAPQIEPQPDRTAAPPKEVQPKPSIQEARPRWMQFRAEDEPEPPDVALVSPQPILTDLINIEHAVLGEAGASNRDRFITTLFGHSIDAYERVLRQLHAIPNWTEASKVIAEEVFRKFQVNIYSDSAILFTDIIEARYLERKT